MITIQKHSQSNLKLKAYARFMMKSIQSVRFMNFGHLYAGISLVILQIFKNQRGGNIFK
jgi:hypothetical protein